MSIKNLKLGQSLVIRAGKLSDLAQKFKDHWFHSSSDEEKKKYIEEHPGSKYAKTVTPKEEPKEGRRDVMTPWGVTTVYPDGEWEADVSDRCMYSKFGPWQGRIFWSQDKVHWGISQGRKEGPSGVVNTVEEAQKACKDAVDAMNKQAN